MKLDSSLISAGIRGASIIENTPNGIALSRMPSDAFPGTDYYMRTCAAGIRLILSTDSPFVSLDMEFSPRSSIDFKGDTDVVIDGGEPVAFIAPEGPNNGDIPEFSFRCELPSDGRRHRVELFLPNERAVWIRSVEMADGAFCEPAVPEDKRILFVGDSITQGFFAGPARTWASVFARRRGADLWNLGIGGACIPNGADLEKQIRNIPCDFACFAFGVNDCNGKRDLNDFRRAARECVKVLSSVCSLLVLTPLPWPDGLKKGRYDSLNQYRTVLQEAAAEFGAACVDGTALVPEDNRYFVDGCHPNLSGMKIIGENLDRLAPVW